MNATEQAAFIEMLTIASNTRTNVKVQELVKDIYWNLKAKGFRPVIVNEKYIEVWESDQQRSTGNETTFRFKKNNRIGFYEAMRF